MSTKPHPKWREDVFLKRMQLLMRGMSISFLGILIFVIVAVISHLDIFMTLAFLSGSIFVILTLMGMIALVIGLRLRNKQRARSYRKRR